MSKKPRRPLVWIDCEMTGLDLDKDGLVEVAVVITDEQLNVVDPGIDIVIRPSQEALDNMGDFVRNMHTESGLIDEFETGVSLEEAQREVLDYVKKFVPQPRQALLAGNSIGTDKAFLERDMPELIDYLHYRVVDVSSIKELAKRWYHRTFEEAPAKHGGHRALADILESIQELVYYRRVLFPQGEGPSRQEARQVAAEVIALGIPNIE
ncbi:MULTISPECIES: oligoribonuclease [Actinomycetaceae]|uniref:oligoribonuclease n=1 Tax=Actinomycetaceae TaxID=2049 RepID=UPI0009F2309C|nr:MULTISPECIES: oligoribonuclease [Actinomycetaceae]MBS6102697.1 oligoribonuclease [Actinomyces sp.]MDP9834728.1 oligoribonuclease [Gleimia europaea]MDU5230649.1 oligoribonuclease [Actinomyces sp.]MDU5568960.1 oligoribonuclease [Actinomyces sp.]MDU6678594.1 oligoribonuclease [Actinomyces sp.]